jgi:hypothetical protein
MRRSFLFELRSLGLRSFDLELGNLFGLLKLLYFFFIDCLLMDKQFGLQFGSQKLHVGFEFEAVDIGNVVDWEFIFLEDKA